MRVCRAVSVTLPVSLLPTATDTEGNAYPDRKVVPASILAILWPLSTSSNNSVAVVFEARRSSFMGNLLLYILTYFHSDTLRLHSYIF